MCIQYVEGNTVHTVWVSTFLWSVLCLHKLLILLNITLRKEWKWQNACYWSPSRKFVIIQKPDFVYFDVYIMYILCTGTSHQKMAWLVVLIRHLVYKVWEYRSIMPNMKIMGYLTCRHICVEVDPRLYLGCAT